MALPTPKPSDAGYIYAPYIPMMSTNDVFGKVLVSDHKQPIVEKLDKNLVDGWSDEAIIKAGEVHEVSQDDVFAYGSSDLAGVFGIDDYEAYAEEYSCRQDKLNEPRKLKAKWSQDAINDLTSMHNVSISKVIEEQLELDLEEEIKKSIEAETQKVLDENDSLLMARYSIETVMKGHQHHKVVKF